MSARHLAIALVALASGCSLSGLDTFARETCEDDACCADLNASMPTGDACLAWQQEPITGYCEALVLDADGDGAPAPECAQSGVAPDCDDADGARAPALAETCDGRDQDCDERVDEDAVGASLASLVALAADASTVVMAGASDNDDAIAIALEGGAGTRTLHLVTAPAGTTPASTDETRSVLDEDSMTVPVLDVGPLASLGGGRYALLVRPAGCARWALATVDLAAETITTGGEALDPGLPKVAGSCPDDTSAVGAAAMAADGEGDLAIAWIAGAGDRECGSATPADVVLAAGHIGAGAPRVGTAAITVGPTDDVAPALLSVGDDTYLLAVASAGTLRIHRVMLDEATLSVSAESVYEEVAPDAGDVHLALGPTDGSSLTFALSWREGCAGETPVATRLLRLVGGAVSAVGAVVESGTGAARRAPRAVWQPRASEWVVTWRTTGGGASAQRLDPAGAPIGMPFAIGCGAASCTGLAGAPLLVARRDGPLYGLEAARFESGSASIEAGTFGCAP